MIWQHCIMQCCHKEHGGELAQKEKEEDGVSQTFLWDSNVAGIIEDVTVKVNKQGTGMMI